MSTRLTPTISALACLLLTVGFTLGCFVEVSSSGSNTPAAAELGSRIEAEFALKTGGVNSTIHCPSGLAGRQGNRLMCSGEMSDGYTLEIAVL